MNKKIISIIGAIILALGSVLVTYYLNRSRAEVKYTLSESIQLTEEDRIENIQKLEVKNVGNAEAERIVVKIFGIDSLSGYQIKKHIASDIIEVNYNPDNIEFVYPILPPGSGFVLTLRSPHGIYLDNISISHNKGTANEALAETRVNLIPYFLILAFIIWLFYMIYLFRDSAIHTWKRNMYSLHVDDILNKHKLWHISEDQNVQIIVEVLEEKIKGYIYEPHINISSPYMLLNQEKPDYISFADWNELIALASNQFENALSNLAESYSETNVLMVIRLLKPKYFPEEIWGSIIERANNHFMKFRHDYLYSLDKVNLALKEKKPEGVSEVVWSKSNELLKEKYFLGLMNEFLIYSSNDDIQEKYDLNLLDDNQRDLLVRLTCEKERYSVLFEMLDQVLNAKEELASVAPESVNSTEWRILKGLEKGLDEINNLDKRISLFEKESSELAIEKMNTKKTKEKILKQLEIINNILKDPTTINRIESYDETFSVGNWDNLKLVADYLKNALE
jgi:hypothetical protein